MAQTAKKQNLWGLIVISAILCGLSYWTYSEVAMEYKSVERSNQVVSALLENQTRIVREYAVDMKAIKEELAGAKEYIQSADAQVHELKDKLAALQSLNGLEAKVTDLEAANERLRKDLEANAISARQREAELAAKLQEFMAELEFDSADEGRAIIDRYQQKIREIKARIKEQKSLERQRDAAARREAERAQALWGNQGYAVLNGAPMLVVTQRENIPSKNVTIDVQMFR